MYIGHFIHVLIQVHVFGIRWLGARANLQVHVVLFLEYHLGLVHGGTAPRIPIYGVL